MEKELRNIRQTLQALNNDTDDEVHKLRLLYTLRDHVELILENTESVEEVVNFLRSFYFGLTKTKQRVSNFFQSQILVTWTTVLLSVDNIDSDKLQESFVIVFDELIQIILNINNVDNCVLRSVACDCIIEMEMEFPGLMNQMLETLHDLSVRETTYVHQKYTLLLSYVCKHQYTVKSDLFDKTHQMLSEILKRQSNIQTLLTSPSMQDSVQQQTVIGLLEHIPTTSSHTASTIIRNVAEIICSTESIPPSVLKSVVLKYKQTYDLCLLHTVCFLQLKFGKDLFAQTEEQQVLFHIVNLSNFPLLPSCQRMIYLDWLQYYANSNKLHSAEKNYADEMKFDSSFALKFSPSIFDDWDILLKKYHLMTNLFSRNADQSDCCRVLFCCFSSSFDVVRWSMNHRSSVIFFRILYIFLKFFPISFRSDFVQFLNDFVHYHSNFSYVVVKFLECIQRDFPENREILWKSVVTFITRTSVDIQTFQNYCVILNQVTNRSFHTCQPKEIITFIKSFLTMSVCSSSSWCLGNQILEICHNLVKYQNSNAFYRELGDLLCLLSTKFVNADVRDSCRLLYMILTSLSSQKINSMFNSVPAVYQSHSVSSLGTETSSYGIASRIAYLSHSPIELIKSDPEFSVEDVGEREIETSIISVLQPYLSFIDSDEYKGVVDIVHTLQFLADDLDDGCYNKLFSIHLKCESSVNVADITVPHLIHPHSRNVIIKLVPRDFKPIKLHYSATFNTINTGTFTCRLKPVCLTFDDYFLPFPVPFSFYKFQFEFRKRLFDELWEVFDKSAQQGFPLSNCEQSVHLIKLSEAQFRPCLRGRFGRFLMESVSSDINEHYRVGIFLPPRYHVLVKFEIRSTDCLARILVDHWSLLSPLNLYLLSLENQKYE